MSGEKRESLSLTDVQEWLCALGFEVDASDEGRITEQLRDGVLLCQLVNRIKPNSVDVIKQRRSSGDAEENILRFLQACTTLGVKKIFKPVDLLHEKRDFNAVLLTLQELYHVAAGMGLGVQFTRRGSVRQPTQGSGNVSGASSNRESLSSGDGNVSGCYTYRALYNFHGTNDDELQFEKGDLITVTKMVDGGWWEGMCNGNVGWFPGNYVEEYGVKSTTGNQSVNNGDSEQQYHNLVVHDIIDSERTYVHDIHTLLSVYLNPLKSTNILSDRDVEMLTGNLAELIKWQQAFLTSLENCSKFPIQQQNFGAIFNKASKEMEVLYTAYCANHPRAVAVLTDNSDKLSTFMESRGAPSPGILELTSNLSKPFRRLEKYSGLLKELQRHLTEGHADSSNVSTAITAYGSLSSKTQEVRKRKEMEYEMLANPVQGYNGSCLLELGECKCVIQANVAISAEEVDERFFLIFSDDFIILAVGRSLSGYELKAKFPMVSVSIKKGGHTEHWPWAVEIFYQQEAVHASMASLKDQTTLIDCISRQEGVPTRSCAAQRSNSTNSRALSRNSSALFRAYNTRAMRQASSAPIQRQHHWGFRSLRPIPPLNAPQLMALKERDRSPKTAKKFIYPAGKKKRASKAMEELHIPGVGRPNPAETRTGDTAILSVVESYCNNAHFKPSMPNEGKKRTVISKLILPDPQIEKLSSEICELKKFLSQERKARKLLEKKSQKLIELLGLESAFESSKY